MIERKKMSVIKNFIVKEKVDVLHGSI